MKNNVREKEKGKEGIRKQVNREERTGKRRESRCHLDATFNSHLLHSFFPLSSSLYSFDIFYSFAYSRFLLFFTLSLQRNPFFSLFSIIINGVCSHFIPFPPPPPLFSSSFLFPFPRLLIPFIQILPSPLHHPCPSF